MDQKSDGDFSIAERELLRSMRALLSSMNDSGDFTLVANDDKEFKVHSVVLMEKGPFFKAALTGDFKEKNDKRLRLELPSKALEDMIKFIYGTSLPEDLTMKP